MADLRFDVSAETKAATAALGSFAQDIQKKLVNAVRSLPDIELTADSTAAQRDMKRLRDEMAALANQRVGVDIDADQALAEMQRLQNELRTLASTTTEVGVRADADAASRALGDVEAEVRRLNGTDAEVEVTADTSQAEQEVSGFGDAAKVGLAAAGAAAGAMFASSVASSMEFGSANAQLQAQLGLSASESERIGGVAGQLYANAYGENIGEVSNAVAKVIQNVDGMSSATNEELQAVTGQMFSLAQSMEIDVGQASIAVGQMIRNGIADNAVEAMDLLAVGAQNGANRMDDLAEVFSEYGETFQTAGLDGATAMGIMVQAMDAGAWSSDLVTDAIREFGIIAQASGEDTEAAFSSIGLNGRQMAEDVAAGGERSVKALDLTLDALRKMPPSAERSAIAVALFGTKAEEMGDSLFAIDPSTATAAIGDFAGAAERADAALGDTAAAKVTALQREYELFSASLITTKGPLGEVSTMLAAFGPVALTAIGAVAPLVLALKMGGVVAALGGVSTAAAGTGAAAGAAAAGGGARLLTSLGSVAKFAGVLGAVFLIDEATNQGLSDAMNSIAGLPTAAERAKAGIGEDFWSQVFQSPAAKPGDMNDIRNIADTVETLRQDFRSEVLGIAMEPIDIDLRADPTGAQTELANFIAQVDGASPEVNINGNDNSLSDTFARAMSEINGGAATVLIDGNPMPAEEVLDYLVGIANSTGGMVEFRGDMRPAGEVLLELTRQATGANPIVAFQGDPTNVNGVITQVVAFADGSVGTVTLDGDPTEVNGETQQAIVFANGSRGVMTLDANSTGAIGSIRGVIDYGNGSTTTVRTYAETSGAYNQMNNFIASFQGRTIDLRVSTAGRLAAGGILAPMADGGVLGRTSTGHLASRYAAGGYGQMDGHQLTPMSANAAAVPPNTWRVVGDRMRDVEVYIPLDGSRRSLGFTEYAAAAQGYSLVPDDARAAATGRPVRGMAAGGALSTARTAAATSAAQVTAVVSAPRALGGGGDAGLVGELRANRAELTALRRDLAAGNYGAATVGELRGLRGDLSHGARPSALDTATRAGARADGGAW